MTTTDARKRNRDMRDAHETAQARDERPRRGSTFAEAAADIVQGLASLRTRTHSINPETGEFTPLDFHREWLHVMDTQRPHTPQESDMTEQPEPYDFHDEAERALLNDNLSKGWQAGLHALLSIDDTLKDIAGNSAEQHATLAEIRDRLPERVEAKVAPFDPDVIAADIEALKHELETPMRGHEECCDPATADVDPDEALAMDLYHDSLLIPPVKEIGPTVWLSERDHEMWLGVARAARKHIGEEP